MNSYTKQCQEDFEGIMDQLSEKPVSMAIGVSGGSDSMAAAYLVSHFCKRHAIPLVALIIDHGLRPESINEAKQTHTWCKELGIKAHILKWSHENQQNLGSLMARARKARYQILAWFCHKNTIPHLITAHHQDDALETLLMRQQKNTGWRGKAAISSLRISYGIALLRPFLHFSKERLRGLLVCNHIPWLEDPSNDNLFFERVRVRNILATWSDLQKKAAWGNILVHAHRREKEAKHLSSLYETHWDPGILRIHNFSALSSIDSAQGGVILKSWAEHFTSFSSNTAKFSLTWQKICQILWAPLTVKPRIIATIGGCLIALPSLKHGPTIHIFREAKRIFCTPTRLSIHIPPLCKFNDKVNGSEGAIWDDRFWQYGSKDTPMPDLFSQGHKHPQPSGLWHEHLSRASCPLATTPFLYRPCTNGKPTFKAPLIPRH